MFADCPSEKHQRAISTYKLHVFRRNTVTKIYIIQKRINLLVLNFSQKGADLNIQSCKSNLYFRIKDISTVP